jgi:hypothetical protein
VSDYAEMARKTVLRRHLKYVPRSAELSAALEHDNEAEAVTLVPELPAAAAPAGNTESLVEELKKGAKGGKAAKEKPAPKPAERPADTLPPATPTTEPKPAPSTKCPGCKEEVDFKRADAVVQNGVSWHDRCLKEAQTADAAIGGREPEQEG